MTIRRNPTSPHPTTATHPVGAVREPPKTRPVNAASPHKTLATQERQHAAIQHLPFQTTATHPVGAVREPRTTRPVNAPNPHKTHTTQERQHAAIQHLPIQHPPRTPVGAVREPPTTRPNPRQRYRYRPRNPTPASDTSYLLQTARTEPVPFPVHPSTQTGSAPILEAAASVTQPETTRAARNAGPTTNETQSKRRDLHHPSQFEESRQSMEQTDWIKRHTYNKRPRNAACKPSDSH